jgi:serine/threonine protein kinase
VKGTGSVEKSSEMLRAAAIKKRAPAAESGLPARFEKAFQGLLAGKQNLDEVLLELANSLYASLEPSAAISQAFEEALSSGTLTADDHRALVAELQQITTEETPTDVPMSGPVKSRAPTIQKTQRTRSPEKVKRSAVTAGIRLEDIRTEQEPARDARAPVEIKLGAVLRHRFQLEERVAGGRMGEIFRAIDRLKEEAGYADPAVAIKVLSRDLRDCPDALRLLQQESLKSQRLAHPNVVNVFDLDKAGSHYFITMEWLRGESLANLLDRSRPRPLVMKEVKRILGGVSAGLSYAHEQGIVHGDVKPGNVFLCRNGHVKLLDFGLARAVESGYHQDTDGPYAMTRAYASCEMLEGRDPNIQDDVYALACMTYRMIVGHRPFGMRTALEAESEGARVKKPADLLGLQWKTLQRGLAYRRADRLQNVEELMRGFCEPATKKPMPMLRWTFAVATGLLVAATGFIAVDYDFDLSRLRQDFTGLDRLIPAVVVAPSPVPSVDEAPDDAAVSQLPELSKLPPSAAGKPAPVDPVFVSSPETVNSPAVESPSTTDMRAGNSIIRNIREPAPVQSADAVPVIVDPLPGVSGESTVSDIEPSVPESGPAALAAIPGVHGPLGFAAARYVVNEGDAFVRLKILYPHDLEAPVYLRVTLVPGSAMVGEDFVGFISESIIIEPGVREKLVLLPVISDAVSENMEDFTVVLKAGNSNPNLDLARAWTMVVIMDDD